MLSKKNVASSGITIMLCLIVLMITGCTEGTVPKQGISGRVEKASPPQQKYRWAFGLSDIKSFDPAIAPDIASIDVINMVFTGLVQLDDTLKVQPQLAQSYEISQDGLTYTFHLRPNLKFSDGSRLDANDVAFSIDPAPTTKHTHQSGVALTYLGLIVGAPERTQGKISGIIGTGVIVQDASTLLIKVRNATAYFLQALTYPTSYVVEKSVVEKWGPMWTDHLADHGGQGGDGPFKVKRYNHSTGIILEPNLNYYGPEPQLEEVDYLPYRDRETSYNAYLAGQTDITAVPLAEFGRVRQIADFSQNPSLTILYIGMNFMVKPLDNIKIRQAFALALNRDLIVKAAWHGAYTPSCHIIPEGMYGYNPHLTCPLGTTTRGDAEKARVLFKQGLREEGLTPATFPSLTLIYPSQSPETANEVTTEVQLWKQVLGVNIATTALSQNSMYNLAAQTTGHDRPLQMWMAGWGADYPDPQDWITLQFGENQPNNAFNFGNNSGSSASQQQELQQQMVEADVMNDTAMRAQAYNRIEQQLVDDVAWLTIYQRPDIRLLKPYVIGLKFNAFSEIPPNDWGNIYIADH